MLGFVLFEVFMSILFVLNLNLKLNKRLDVEIGINHLKISFQSFFMLTIV